MIAYFAFKVPVATILDFIYSATNSTGATQRFSTNHKTSLEQKN